MRDFTAVDAVAKHQIECRARNGATTVYGSVGPDPMLALDTLGRKLLLEISDRLDREITTVDVDHHVGFSVIYDQHAIFDVVAERRHAAHPHALSLGGGDLVAHALADDLALELREGQQHVQRQSSPAAGGIKL